MICMQFRVRMRKTIAAVTNVLMKREEIANRESATEETGNGHERGDQIGADRQEGAETGIEIDPDMEVAGEPRQ